MRQRQVKKQNDEQGNSVSLDMLLDTPEDHLGKDLMGFGKYVNALYRIIDSPRTKGPFVIAINAPWGAGKSSLASMLKRRLESTPAMDGKYPHRVTWFNAWMHDDVDHLSSSFISHIAYSAHRKRSWISQFLHPIPNNLIPKSSQISQRILTIIKMLLVTGIIFLSVFLLFPFLGKAFGFSFYPLEFTNLAKTMGSESAVEPGLLGVIFLIQFIIKKAFTGLTTLSEYIKSPSEEAKGGQLRKLRSELNKLIDQATPKGSKFVVFVDDLERCRNRGSVEVLESINQLLESDKIVVVVLAELKLVSRVVENKYREIIKDTDVNFGFNYIQKIIQVIFTLPSSPQINWEKFKKPFGSTDEKEEQIELKDDFWSFSFFKYNYSSGFNLLLKIFYFIPTLARYAFYKVFLNDYNLAIITVTKKVVYANNSLMLLLLGMFGMILLAESDWILISVFSTMFSISCILIIGTTISVFKTQAKKVRNGSLNENDSVLSDWTKDGIKDQLNRTDVEDSEDFKKSLDELINYLQEVDMLTLRNVKRATNRFRLMYFIFNYEVGDKIDSKLLARWVVILEKWPNLLSFVKQNGGSDFLLNCSVRDSNFPEFGEDHPFVKHFSSLKYSNSELYKIFNFCLFTNEIQIHFNQLINLEE